MCVEENANHWNLNTAELYTSHCNGNSEKGPLVSEITRRTSETPQEAEPPADGCIAKLKNKSVPMYSGIIVGIVCVIVGFFGGRLSMSSVDSCPKCMLPCPQGWAYNDGKCYCFSSAEDDWASSQENCSSDGASLATIDTPQELKFLFCGMKCKGPSHHWIGLRREGEKDPWKWTNGSTFNNWFEIGSNGNCAYLNDEAASSTACDRIRHWICSKPAYTT